MLMSFVEWAKRAQISQAEGVEMQLTESVASDNPSARLDIDTPTSVARITCWETGDYDAEVIDLDTERTLYSTRGVFQNENAIEDQLLDFFTAVGVSTR